MISSAVGIPRISPKEVLQEGDIVPSPTVSPNKSLLSTKIVGEGKRRLYFVMASFTLILLAAALIDSSAKTCCSAFQTASLAGQSLSARNSILTLPILH